MEIFEKTMEPITVLKRRKKLFNVVWKILHFAVMK